MTNMIIMQPRLTDPPDQLTPDPQRLGVWLDALYSGEWAQTHGYLNIVQVEGSDRVEVGACCLGVGCDVAGIVSRKDTLPLAGDATFDAFRYGEEEMAQLAPWEFMDWLFPHDAWVQQELRDNPDKGFNLGLDWPEDLTLPLHVDDVTRSSSIHNAEAAEVGGLAALNDSGFTFAQIADLIRRFGFSRLIY